MALYVVKENQELLWNVINNNTFVKQYFAKVGPERKHTWFKNIIENFYEQNKNNQLTVPDLHKINRSTIAYMIENIRMQDSQNVPFYNDQINSRLQTNGIYTPPVIPNNKQEQYASQFDQRQQEYQQMVEKKTPPEIDFSEKNEKDSVISNMDELMKQHMQDREKELQIYKPSSAPSNTLRIDNSANIQVEVEELTTPLDNDVTKSKRNVSWSNDLENDRLHIDYKHKYDELLEKYKGIEENMKTLTRFLTENSEKYRLVENKLNYIQENYSKKDNNDDIAKQILILQTKYDNNTNKNRDISNKFDSMEMNMNLLTKIVEKINGSMKITPEPEEKSSELSN